MALPWIDDHEVEVAAPPAAVWRALVDWIGRGWSDPTRVRFARLLGCEQVEGSGKPGEVGSTFPGFRVARSEPPRALGLEGRHRFSRYALDFRIDDLGDGRSRLRATTHAAFPGLKGQLYKTAVIRSRAHVFATSRILQAVARRAERGTL